MDRTSTPESSGGVEGRLTRGSSGNATPGNYNGVATTPGSQGNATPGSVGDTTPATNGNGNEVIVGPTDSGTTLDMTPDARSDTTPTEDTTPVGVTTPVGGTTPTGDTTPGGSDMTPDSATVVVPPAMTDGTSVDENGDPLPIVT